ncbi:chromate efflux transporter [Rhizobium paknamense]|uniref:Chromate transporter n=1 Tax=Rhizobium paknamense TaxID=1206817 RepID=A0ABU0IBE9_9HYPH|nr:chromate efflux transporter [Rhizobium paknamense]MDQ0454973.1 chromate transporter [Rhizobium paknamense]
MTEPCPSLPLAPSRPAVSKADLSAAFFRVGLMSFGGPAAQIGLMHRLLVEEKAWLTEARFLHALNYCMLLPGPEAQQLATYTGWLLQGVRGGLIAGLLFVLPGLAVMLGLSAAYALWHDIGWVAGLFFGLKAAVIAIVFEALLRIARRALKDGFHLLLAALAFLALFVFSLPFPLVVALAAFCGLLRTVVGVRIAAPPVEEGPLPPLQPKTLALSVLAWTALWLSPLLIFASAPQSGIFPLLFSFFAKLAVVTFGGAYAVLAYVGQVAVEHYRWLSPQEMLDGLALAETTPGPLVLVLSFIGFLAAFRASGGWEPVVAGLVGGLLVAWATFGPSFLFIFAGAPLIERLRGEARVAGALSAITAAVVGVILNLAVWLALHVLFADVGEIRPLAGAAFPWPQLASLQFPALAITLVSALLLFGLRQGVGRVLTLAAILGLLWRGGLWL